jgi:hypothetical protein
MLRLLQNCFTILTTAIRFQLLLSWDVVQVATSHTPAEAIVWYVEAVGVRMAVTDVRVGPEARGLRTLFPSSLFKPLQARQLL